MIIIIKYFRMQLKHLGVIIPVRVWLVVCSSNNIQVYLVIIQYMITKKNMVELA